MSGIKPSLIIKNGRLWTMNEAEPCAEALAVYGHDIAAIGRNAEIESLAGPGTEVIDVGGGLSPQASPTSMSTLSRTLPMRRRWRCGISTTPP